MISLSAEELRARATSFAARLDGVAAQVLEGSSLIGGGSTPEQPLASWLIAMESKDVVETERRLRFGVPPVVARIEHGRLLFDLRTVFQAEEEELARAILDAVQAG
jgi:L-seryl-tRNA(Ser) seleniumtransferase